MLQEQLLRSVVEVSVDFFNLTTLSKSLVMVLIVNPFGIIVMSETEQSFCFPSLCTVYTKCRCVFILKTFILFCGCCCFFSF